MHTAPAAQYPALLALELGMPLISNQIFTSVSLVDRLSRLQGCSLVSQQLATPRGHSTRCRARLHLPTDCISQGPVHSDSNPESEPRGHLAWSRAPKRGAQTIGLKYESTVVPHLND